MLPPGVQSPRSFAIAWWIWMLGQLAALAICVGQIPLSNHFPQPIEDSALIAVAIVQIVLAVLLAPILLPDGAAVACTFAGGAVMTVAAGALLGNAPTSAVPAVIWLALWLLALTGARVETLRPVLAMLAIGGTAAFYAAHEAGESQQTSWLTFAYPPLGAISSFYHPLPTLLAAIGLPVLLISYKILHGMQLRRTSQRSAVVP